MTTGHDRSTSTIPWFAPDDALALADFWAVFAVHEDAIEDTMRRAAAAQPAFVSALRALGPDALARQRAARIDALHRARSGNWAPYESSARAFGARYARGGVGFTTWIDVTTVLARELAPQLIVVYGSDGPRLTAALDVMRRFVDRLIAVIGEEYLRVRDALQRATDGARQRAEARFARLAEAGILGVVITRLDGRVVEINDTLLALVGYPREVLLSGAVRVRDLTPPEYARLDAEAVAELADVGIATLREKEYIHRDGRRVPVLVGSAMLDGSDEAISFVLDLTERKGAEATIAQLRRERVAEAKFRGLLEGSPDATVIVGADGRIELVTAQTVRVFGYTPGELVGQPAALLTVEPVDVLRARAAFGAVEVRAHRKDGTYFAAEITIAPLVTEDGTLISAAIRDISARKMAENALRIANRELEAFSYSVAHDLRAPLRGIRGFAQLLVEAYADRIDDEGQDWLQEILQNAQRMGALIDALLALARVARGAIHAERVDLSELARVIAAELAAPEPTRAVSIGIARGLVAVLDPALARALLENLLGNAWKFTGHVADARIEVGVTVVDAATALFVRDNGAGFDMAFAAQLFAPFRRLHTVDEFPGTGIGLATVQRIVDRHAGRVWAEGYVDGGATFYATLPGLAQEPSR